MDTDEKALQRIAELLTEIRDELHGTSDTLQRIVNNQDEMIQLLGALLDVTAGVEPE